jgi:hypothetical protein
MNFIIKFVYYIYIHRETLVKLTNVDMKVSDSTLHITKLLVIRQYIISYTYRYEHVYEKM